MKIKELKTCLGSEVQLQGFVESVRNLQYVMFIVLRDETGKVQITIEKEQNAPLAASLELLSNESTISVTGIVSENEKVKLNQMEVIPSTVIITSLSKNELPIDLKNKENTLRDTRMDYRFLDLRREENRIFFQINTLLEHKMREFFILNGFLEIHSPKISGMSAESGAEVFKLDYFGQEACLSQSPQFYKQMGMSAGFGKVFEIGPAFRAENSNTPFHATEINMVDAEISYIDSHEDVMDMQEAWIKYFISEINTVYGEKMKSIWNVELVPTDVAFPRLTFAEAKRIVKEECHYTGEKDSDFDRKEEELLSDYVKKHFNSDFVFVTKFPFAARPFYHRLDADGLTNSYDLIFRGVEISTGAQREHDVEVLTKQIIEKGIDPTDLDFYLDFFRYGCPPHGGFGVGVARIMMRLLGIDNIKEATFIYRGPTRLKP